jgi:hypothetical protein
MTHAGQPNPSGPSSPIGFGEFGGGALGLVFEAIGGGEREVNER